MGKDRRKKDGTRKQVDASVPVEVGSKPKSQQGPTNRESGEQRLKDDSKNVDVSLRDKILDRPPSQSDSNPGETPQDFLLFNLFACDTVAKWTFYSACITGRFCYALCAHAP
jgi:hypothetical protein